METKTLAHINNTDVQVVENEKGRFIPIKPICQLLGIDSNGQKQRIENDKILSSVACMTHATGADGKQYEMFCIEYKYIFGWLFTIDASRVKPEAQEAVIKYQKECYDVLFEFYNSRVQFLEEKQKIVDAKLLVVDELRESFKNTEKNLKQARAEFEEARKMNYGDWWKTKRQMEIPFE